MGRYRITAIALGAELHRLWTETPFVFSLPLQSRPGWRRIGIDMPVPALAAQIGAIKRQGGKSEHAYDY
jgi:hypothetical protein